MSDNNSNNRNVYDLNAIGLRPLYCIYLARSELLVTSLPPPLSGDVSERINALQSKLAAHTRELGDVKANYDRALVEAALGAREIAELRA